MYLPYTSTSHNSVCLRGICRDTRYVTLPCVTVYHIASANRTTDVHKTWYRSSIMIGIMETEDSFFFFSLCWRHREKNLRICLHKRCFLYKKKNTVKHSFTSAIIFMLKNINTKCFLYKF